MKHFTLLLLFGLLCKAIDAEPSTCEDDDRISFSVEKIWQSYQTKAKIQACDDDESWKGGVQKYYSGCRTAAWKFHGKAYQQADIVVNSLQEYLTKLIYFANSNSTLLASSTSAMLKTLSRSSQLNQSSFNIMFVFDKVFPLIINELIQIAVKLSDHIGELAYSFANAANDFSSELCKYMKEFVEGCHLSGCREVIDYIPVLKHGQKLMNAVALIGETLLNECECEATQEVYESVFLLDLFYLYVALSITGVHSCVVDLTHERNISVSKCVEASMLAFEYALVQVTQGVSAVILPFDKSIKDFLTLFVNITMTLNTTLKDTLGLFDGTDETVEEIAKNLKNCDKVEICACKRQTNILKGVTSK